MFLYRGARCVESPPQASGAERGVRHVPDNPACRHYRPTAKALREGKVFPDQVQEPMNRLLRPGDAIYPAGVSPAGALVGDELRERASGFHACPKLPGMAGFWWIGTLACPSCGEHLNP